MTDRVHHHPNLIYTLGTQVVTLVEVLGQSGKVLQPRGSVGVVIYSPADLDHPYRVRFADGVEGSLNRDQLTMLARYKESEICLPVAVVLNLPERHCQDRNHTREERDFGPHVIRQQHSQLRRSLRGLGREGFRHVFVLESPDDVEAATVEWVPLWNDKRQDHGPFDIIGDVHGCCDELEALLKQLGYEQFTIDGMNPGWGSIGYCHPAGRKSVFVGDLVDRGPRVLDTLGIVHNMMVNGSALCVPGNHDMKLMRKLRGKDVQITHGLANSLAEIDALPEQIRDAYCKELAEFLDGLVSHYVLDDGRLVVAHAGMKAEMQGRGSGKVRDFALYGETTGETDEFGLPVRFNWAAEYRGSAMVIYGHTPVPEPDWVNRTVNIDTGCVFGGKLTALRYPEKEFVSVPAARTYCEPARPFLPEDQQAPKLTAQQAHDDVLDADDVLGKRIVSTRLRGNVTIQEAHATAALEVMSRFAANPKWLIYLPPTMSPCETSSEPGLLEHPAEAFSYFRRQGAASNLRREAHGVEGGRRLETYRANAQAALQKHRLHRGSAAAQMPCSRIAEAHKVTACTAPILLRPRCPMTLAACLIVKNEALVIQRCLDSLRGLVQAVVVVDTGSTDNTVAAIRGMDFPVPIHLHQRPWKNFGYNRTELLQLAKPVADHLLLLDADQTVAGTVPALDADAYTVRLRNGRLEWWNTLLVRSALPWRYEGVTHEYLTCPEAAPAVPLHSLVITEHADGGGRPPGTQPRWEWDAGVLESELAKDPENTRYVFYLARTYDDLAVTRPQDSQAADWRRRALERYRQRSQMAGYADEVFYSFYRQGVLRLGESDALLLLLEAWQRCPQRWEPVHEACRWLNQRGLHQASYGLSKQALANAGSPSGLFVFPDVYDHLLLFEHSISAYWVGQYAESLAHCQALLAKTLPPYIEEAVRRNIVFPQQKLGLP